MMTDTRETTNSVIVVGISGTTNSGKTTLVQRLVEEFPGSHSMCQDVYFYEPGDERLAPLYIPELDHHDWEDYRALDMDRMVNDVKRHILLAEEAANGTPVLIFIEGFSLFGWKPLVPLFDKKYFLTVSKDICDKRRQTRYYNPPDVPGYFDQVVWPKYLDHLQVIKDQEDIVYVDSDEGVNRLYDIICKDLRSRF